MGMFITMLAMAAAQAPTPPQPIIDVHFHALNAADQGPPPTTVCTPYEDWPVHDASKPIEQYLGDFVGAPKCARSVTSPRTDAELVERNAAVLERMNVTAVTSGPAAKVAELQRRAGKRVIPAVSFGAEPAWPSVDELRALHREGRLAVIGEVTAQYAGIAPDDPRLEPYYALAEELDVPLGIHVGPGPPGVPYFGAPGYRMGLSRPLALEGVLMRHPKLRLYVMHAGWPMADEMIALMYAHPRVHVDTGVIDFAFPRAEFHAYLKRLVDAGFAKRIMFGSDAMVWPEALEVAVRNIESADFLTAEQKRDILYNNAARFLRLER